MTARIFRTSCFLFATTLWLYLPQAHADYVDGNHLWELARKDDYYSNGFYNGYVTGMADGYNETIFCLRQGVTVEQISDIVTQYLRAHPENRHMEGTFIVWQALGNAFPCATD